jgi:hypothetical protein
MMLFITETQNFGFKGRAITWAYVYGSAVEGRNEGMDTFFRFLYMHTQMQIVLHNLVCLRCCRRLKASYLIVLTLLQFPTRCQGMYVLHYPQFC